MTNASEAHRTLVRKEHVVSTQPRRARRFSVAGYAAALVAFIAACDPNTALRYGPFIAAAAFMLSRPWRYRIGVTEWALAAYLLWALMSQIWTQHPNVFTGQIIVLASLATMFVGVRAATWWGQNQALTVTGYIAGCLYGLAQTSFQLITGEGEVYTDEFGRITQVGTLNINYVAYTTLTAIVLILLALQGGQVKRRRMKMLMYAVLVILMVGAVSTQTRGVHISLVLLGAWILVSKFGRPMKTITTACVVAIVSVSAGWASGFLDDLDRGNRGIEGLSGRTTLWESARSKWVESFFAGEGLGADRVQNAGYLPTHNTFLGLGITLGMVGLALFLIFAVSSLNDRIQGLSVRDRRFRLITIILAFTPILLTSSWEAASSGWVGLALLSTPILAAANQIKARRKE